MSTKPNMLKFFPSHNCFCLPGWTIFSLKFPFHLRSEHLTALAGRQRAPQPPRTALRRGYLRPLSGDIHSSRALEAGCRSRGHARHRTLVPNASAVGVFPPPWISRIHPQDRDHLQKRPRDPICRQIWVALNFSWNVSGFKSPR